MICLQIVEHYGANLHRRLLGYMRSGSLQTFSSSKRGRKISHLKYPGWINWSSSGGVITCEVLSPRRPNEEWQLMHAFLGRLAARFAPSIIAINIQFPTAPDTAGGTAASKKRKATKSRPRSRKR
jgi:hypothetical protein